MKITKKSIQSTYIDIIETKINKQLNEQEMQEVLNAVKHFVKVEIQPDPFNNNIIVATVNVGDNNVGITTAIKIRIDKQKRNIT